MVAGAGKWPREAVKATDGSSTSSKHYKYKQHSIHRVQRPAAFAYRGGGSMCISLTHAPALPPARIYSTASALHISRPLDLGSRLLSVVASTYTCGACTTILH